jgi:tRNA(Ile)-lysidine synthetase-like protein
MIDDPLQSAIARVPQGAWAVGVSGGADSVALLLLLLEHDDLRLHVVHLNHETRGDASTADARFVEQLATNSKLPCTIARRSEIEARLSSPPSNISARYRAARLDFFRQVVERHALSGVILAHHADDQAETVLQRLLRGSGSVGLAGMRERQQMGNLLVLRPLLGTRRAQLRELLMSRAQPWRDDASNESLEYGRNRIRRLLASREGMTRPMLELGDACSLLRDWQIAHAPTLPETFDAKQLDALPDILQRVSATRWLAENGVPRGEISPSVIRQFISMASDAATPARQHFPGGVLVHRKHGKLCTGSS